jgi:AAA+ superfamily predicted ATPase
VLFFDEADSFLGKRIENVTQGAEQALNSLRSQMLIQLEQFPGIVLFATNLVTNFDHAFESRILKHIQFEMPNQEARVAIIRKMLPSQLPLDKPFDDDQLMEASALIDGFSGREIKTAILELLLSKAGDEHPVITFDDLCQVFSKKSEEKKELARQEEERLKKKIEKKLKEKAAENKALEAQRAAEQESADDATEVPSVEGTQEPE